MQAFCTAYKGLSPGENSDLFKAIFLFWFLCLAQCTYMISNNGLFWHHHSLCGIKIQKHYNFGMQILGFSFCSHSQGGVQRTINRIIVLISPGMRLRKMACSGLKQDSYALVLKSTSQLLQITLDKECRECQE